MRKDPVMSCSVCDRSRKLGLSGTSIIWNITMHGVIIDGNRWEKLFFCSTKCRDFKMRILSSRKTGDE